MFYNCEGQSHKIVSTDHNFWRERIAEVDSNWGPLLTSLTPYHQAKLVHTVLEAEFSQLVVISNGILLHSNYYSTCINTTVHSEDHKYVDD